MKHQAGVWIDHRKALIVTVTADGQETSLVVSNVQTQPRREAGAGTGSHEALQVPADDRRLRALNKHLNTYYDMVIAAIQDARAVYLCGPGESKLELKKRLGKQGLAGLVGTVESADRMTDRQFVARVRRHFHVDAPRREPKLRPVIR